MMTLTEATITLGIAGIALLIIMIRRYGNK